VIVELASTAGIELKSVSIHKPTLNDVFLHYTGREIRAEEAENEMRKVMRIVGRRR